MINPKELRLGNHIWLGKEAVPVLKLEQTGPEEFKINGQPPTAFDPIPVDPDFMFRNNLAQADDYHFMFIARDGYSVFNFRYADYPYLHQIQNLSSAIMGIEWTLIDPVSTERLNRS